jgi:sigma-70-like protein
MMTTELMNLAERDDAELVADCLAGDRAAFQFIVERYQSLICSVAYNATGNLSESEDVAQETFLTAWTELRSLREPEKLRSWLCGIVRNRIRRSARDDRHEPVCGAASGGSDAAWQKHFCSVEWKPDDFCLADRARVARGRPGGGAGAGGRRTRSWGLELGPIPPENRRGRCAGGLWEHDPVLRGGAGFHQPAP